MILSFALSTGCFDGNGSSGSESSDGDGASDLQSDGSSEGVTGAAATQGGAEDRATCDLPDEEDFRIEHPETDAELLFNEVLPSHLDQLYRAVGQFARGDTRILKGTVDVLEHRSVVVNEENIEMSSTRAVASLGYEEQSDFTAPNGIVLTMFDPDARSMVRMVQVDNSVGFTSVCGVHPFRSSCGLPATCSNCLTRLASVSDVLAMNFTALGTYGDSDQSEMRIDVAAELEVIPPAELSMHDILIVNSTIQSPLLMLREPTLEGDTYVFAVEGQVPTSAGVDENGCKEEVVYEAEWFVRQDCLLDYGIREFVLGEPFPVCPTQG